MTKQAEIFFDTQDPDNEGWAYRIFERDEMGRRYDLESGPIDGLDQLEYVMQHEIEDDRVLSGLPTFGGEEPTDTSGVWSWDEGRLLVGEDSNSMEIVSR